MPQMRWLILSFPLPVAPLTSWERQEQPPPPSPPPSPSALHNGCAVLTETMRKSNRGWKVHLGSGTKASVMGETLEDTLIAEILQDLSYPDRSSATVQMTSCYQRAAGVCVCLYRRKQKLQRRASLCDNPRRRWWRWNSSSRSRRKSVMLKDVVMVRSEYNSQKRKKIGYLTKHLALHCTALHSTCVWKWGLSADVWILSGYYILQLATLSCP